MKATLSPKEIAKWVIVNLPELIAGGALIFAITLTMINAFTRYLLHYTINGSDEFVCIAFAWIVFPGTAAAYRRKMHYGVDLLVSKLPARLQTCIQLLTQAIILVIMCTLTYLSLELYRNVGTKIMTATRISYRVLDSGMLFGFALMSLYSLIFLVQDIRNLPTALRTHRKEASV